MSFEELEAVAPHRLFLAAESHEGGHGENLLLLRRELELDLLPDRDVGRRRQREPHAGPVDRDVHDDSR
jgi:hypothetical protein